MPRANTPATLLGKAGAARAVAEPANPHQRNGASLRPRRPRRQRKAAPRTVPPGRSPGGRMHARAGHRHGAASSRTAVRLERPAPHGRPTQAPRRSTRATGTHFPSAPRAPPPKPPSPRRQTSCTSRTAPSAPSRLAHALPPTRSAREWSRASVSATRPPRGLIAVGTHRPRGRTARAVAVPAQQTLLSHLAPLLRQHLDISTYVIAVCDHWHPLAPALPRPPRPPEWPLAPSAAPSVPCRLRPPPPRPLGRRRPPGRQPRPPGPAAGRGIDDISIGVGTVPEHRGRWRGDRLPELLLGRSKLRVHRHGARPWPPTLPGPLPAARGCTRRSAHRLPAPPSTTTGSAPARPGARAHQTSRRVASWSTHGTRRMAALCCASARRWASHHMAPAVQLGRPPA